MALIALTGACGNSNPLGGGLVSADLKVVVVGSADFPKPNIVAAIYAQAPEADEFTVARKSGIGSRETHYPGTA